MSGPAAAYAVRARIARRQLLGAVFGALAALGEAACAPERRPRGPAASVPYFPLALDPLVDLVPAAGLEWLVAINPPELLASPALAAVVSALVPDEQFETFARRHGAVDLRRADQIAVAGHARSTLGLARLPVEPWRIEAAFAARARVVEGRAVERGVTRFWGTVGDEREQVAVFGGRGVGIERGALGPLRVALYFAEGRLKRSAPALRSEPLAAASGLLGDAPVRGFAPGPFVGPWATGLGGLLGASTALAASLRGQEGTRPAAGGARDGAGGAGGARDGAERGNGGAGLEATATSGPSLALRLVLTGAWGQDAPAAAERLGEAFQLLAEDPVGRLAGLDRPLADPVTSAAPDALALDVALDPVRMVAGVRAVMGAPVAEIMAF